MRKLITFACAVLILSGCCDDPCGPGDREMSPFEVRVLATNLYGEPVEGAWIEGGVDWDRFRVSTDSNGVATLPGRARDTRALIYRNDYHPRVVDLGPWAYWILPTAKRLEHIGKVSDTAIRFSSGMLLTLEYGGKYRAYSYSDTSVTKLVETLLPGSAIQTKKFYGDTLWYSTHDSGVFVHSVEDPLNPVHLFSLDIPGYLRTLAVKGWFIATAQRDEPVRVFSYSASGEMHKVSEIEAYYVKQMDFRSNYLVMLSYDRYELGSATLMIADLSVPEQPEITYTLEEQGGRSGLILDDTVLIGPFGYNTASMQSYTAVDIQDPGNPTYMGRAYSDSWLLDASAGSHAVGSYCPERRLCDSWSEAYSVLELTPEGDWMTVATTCNTWYVDGCVHSPPHFVLGASLWRLQD